MHPEGTASERPRRSRWPELVQPPNRLLSGLEGTLAGPPKTRGQDVQDQTQPELPALQESRLYDGLWQRGHGGHNVDRQLHSNLIPDAAGDEHLQTTPIPDSERDVHPKEGLRYGGD